MELVYIYLKSDDFMNLNRKGVFVGIVLAVAVSAIYLGFVLTSPIVEQTVMQSKKIPFLVTGDYAPGEGVSGFFYFIIIAHQASPSAIYAYNNISHTTTNATIFEYADTFNISATGETPYNTLFDIVLKYGVTDNDGQSGNATGFWDENYFWVTMNSVNLTITNLNCTKYFIGKNSTYEWFHAVATNGGAGYQIAIGQTYQVNASYYVQRNSS